MLKDIIKCIIITVNVLASISNTSLVIVNFKKRGTVSDVLANAFFGICCGIAAIIGIKKYND